MSPKKNLLSPKFSFISSNLNSESENSICLQFSPELKTLSPLDTEQIHQNKKYKLSSEFEILLGSSNENTELNNSFEGPNYKSKIIEHFNQFTAESSDNGTNEETQQRKHSVRAFNEIVPDNCIDTIFKRNSSNSASNKLLYNENPFDSLSDCSSLFSEEYEDLGNSSNLTSHVIKDMSLDHSLNNTQASNGNLSQNRSIINDICCNSLLLNAHNLEEVFTENIIAANTANIKVNFEEEKYRDSSTLWDSTINSGSFKLNELQYDVKRIVWFDGLSDSENGNNENSFANFSDFEINTKFNDDFITEVVEISSTSQEGNENSTILSLSSISKNSEYENVSFEEQSNSGSPLGFLILSDQKPAGKDRIEKWLENNLLINKICDNPVKVEESANDITLDLTLNLSPDICNDMKLDILEEPTLNNCQRQSFEFSNYTVSNSLNLETPADYKQIFSINSDPSPININNDNLDNSEAKLPELQMANISPEILIHNNSISLNNSKDNFLVNSQEMNLQNVSTNENVSLNLNLECSNKCLQICNDENLDNAEKRLRAGIDRIVADQSILMKPTDTENNKINYEEIKKLLVHRIKQTMIHLLQASLDRKPLAFVVKRHTWENCIFEDDVLQLKHTEILERKIISKHNKTTRQKFDLMVYLLGKSYSLLLNNQMCTQREIYYQLKSNAVSQDKIGRSMDAISSLLKIEPWFLPIVPTSKGLVYGDLKIILSTKETIYCNAGLGTLIPQVIMHIEEFQSKADFILVVEKDAIFKKLLDEDIPNKLTRPFLLITGKGYPDTNTRLFLRKLTTTLKIPIFILVDADGYGIDIMLTYRFGSKNSVHISEKLAIPNMRWLGIHPSEILSLNINRQEMNANERKQLTDMLKRPYIKKSPWLFKEITTLLESNVKAEIEGVMKSSSYLTDFYLYNKFYNLDYL